MNRDDRVDMVRVETMEIKYIWLLIFFLALQLLHLVKYCD